MTLAEFNALPSAQAESLLMDCCGSSGWAAEGVSSRRPFENTETLHKSADAIWWNLFERADWLGSFQPSPANRRQGPPAGSEAAAPMGQLGEQSGDARRER